VARDRHPMRRDRRRALHHQFLPFMPEQTRGASDLPHRDRSTAPPARAYDYLARSAATGRGPHSVLIAYGSTSRACEVGGGDCFASTSTLNGGAARSAGRFVSTNFPTTCQGSLTHLMSLPASTSAASAVPGSLSLLNTKISASSLCARG